jgi:predicted RNA-binding protein with RPS1 domain
VAQKSIQYTKDEEIKADFKERQQLAASGREELAEELEEYNAKSPQLSGGDLDADWQSASVTGEEAVGGTTPTPDQDVVSELGEALGLTYEDDEPLAGAEKLQQRDQKRWELNPESVDKNEAQQQTRLEQQLDYKRKDKRMNIKEGQILEGEITRVVDEAAFIDIGTAQEAVISRKNLDGLSQSQLNDIEAGESTEVRIDHLPENGGNPLVSLPQSSDSPSEHSAQTQDTDPWHKVEETYQVGDVVEGTVQNIKKYGAFVELPIGVDGLIHVSEMQSGFTPSPWDVVNSGEQVRVRIIKIEPERERIGLSLIGLDNTK